MPRQKKQVLKRRADGRYCCTYHGLQFMGRESDEALNKRKEYIMHESEQPIVKSPTVREYIAKWLPLYKQSVSARTYADYQKQLSALLPAIGNKRMNAVTVDDAAAVWTHFAGYSASTIHRAKMLYVALFETAIENDLCRKNPFKSRFAQPPDGTHGTHRALTDAEIFFICSTPHRFRLAALIMLYCGLRRGEVLALSSDDIDLSSGFLSVTKAVRFIGNHSEIVSPKTEAGIRLVPIPNALVPSLRDLSGLVAPSASGDIMTKCAFKRAWDSYLLALSRAAGFRISIRPHDFRHTYCTMLRDAGIDLKQAMLWLGHADEKMILHIYDHITEKRTQMSIRQMNKIISKKAKNQLIPMQNHMHPDTDTPQTLTP